MIGLKQALGDKAASMIVAEAAYEATDPTVDSQIVRLKTVGADLLYNISSPKFAAQAIRKVAELDWKPVHIMSINTTSVGGVLKPAGFDSSQGIISVNYGKDPGDPTWDNDPGMKNWRAFMDQYYPEGDKNSSFNIYGYSTAQMLAIVLRNCGDNLTRENVMKQATNLKDVQLDLLLPGIVTNTSPTDYRVNKQLQMMRFKGERWEGFVPIITDDYSG
jgi:branched-chain amino acid transport system substrate-binding protein